MPPYGLHSSTILPLFLLIGCAFWTRVFALQGVSASNQTFKLDPDAGHLSPESNDFRRRLIAHEDTHTFMRKTSASEAFLKEQEQLKVVNGKPEVTIVIYDKIKGYLNWQVRRQ